MRPGDPVLFRSVYGGRVRWCFPHRFVAERDGVFVLYCRPGDRGKLMGHEDGYLELGILDEEAAAAVRAEGERVIAEAPWPTGWEDWRPPPEWEPLALPEDWHVVEA